MIFLYCLGLLSFLFGFSLAMNQNITSQIPLDTQLTITLEEGKLKIYSITIKERIPTFYNLYLEIHPKDVDLLHIPYVILKEGQYKLFCYNSNLTFSGICKIPTEQLRINRTFIIQIKCLADCELNCKAYFNKYSKIQLGSTLQLQKLQEIFQIVIPQNFASSAIVFQAIIVNLQQNIQIGENGIDLYLKYDKQSSDFSLNNSIGSLSLNGIGKQIIFRLGNLSTVNMLELIVIVRGSIKIRLSAFVIDNQYRNIELGIYYLEIAVKQSKIYQLDLDQLNLTLENRTIRLQISIFSGSPQFTIYFDRNLTKSIALNKSYSSITFPITQTIRSAYSFTGLIYLHAIQKEQQSYYQFRFHLTKQNIAIIQPYLSYYDQVNQQQWQNYIMIQDLMISEQNQKIVNYSIKVDIIEGKGEFYVKKCRQIEQAIHQNPNFSQCLTLTQQMTNLTFDNLAKNIIQSQNYLTIIFQLDIDKCNDQNTDDSVRCGFLISSHNSGKGYFKYSMMVQKRHLTTYLQQNKIVKQYLYQQNYAFYAFTLPTVDFVQEINIFITTLSGQTALIASTQNHFPVLSDNSSTIYKQLGSNGNILIKKLDLAKNIYISVYAYQYSQIWLGVTVKRKTQNDSIHQIPLLQGISQMYLLDDQQSQINFRIEPIKKQNYKLMINEITGAIDYKIKGQNQAEIKCKDNKSNRLSCNFSTINSSFIIITVTISNNQTSKFSISLIIDNRACISSPLNEPIYLVLESHESKCFQFNINRQISIFYSSSQSHLQLFQQQIAKNISINGKQLKDTDANHRIVIIDQLETYCQNLGGKTCKMYITFQNLISNNSYLNFIMSEEDSEIALYDGISQRINEKFIAPQISNFFYFSLSSSNPLKLYLTSHTPNQYYYLSCQIISKQNFMYRKESKQSVYPSYVQQQFQQTQKMSNGSRLLGFNFGKSEYFKLQLIQQSIIQKYCPLMECYLVISIYSRYLEQIEYQEVEYQIQISQQETYLGLGDSKIGMLNRQQLYTYIVDPADAIIEFLQINTEQNGLICLKATATTSNGTIIKKNQLKNNIILKKQDNVERIIVEGEKNRCSFSIKYLQIGNIVQSARLSHPYEIIIKDRTIYYFLHYHNSNSSFRGVQLSRLGNVNFQALPLKSDNISISQLVKLNLSRFAHFGSNEGQLIVDTANNEFCSKCYYFIAITSDSDFIGQVIFLREKDPIPLAVEHISKQWLQKQTVFSKQAYVYYSINSFIISFNVLLGNITVLIVNPSGKTEVSQQIYKQQTYFIQSPFSEYFIGPQLYSDDQKYTIQVQTITKQAEFYVQVRKSELTFKIFEGYPCQIFIDQIMAQSIQFTNSKETTNPLELMIITEQSEDILLNFIVTGQRIDKQLIPSQQILKSIVKSENIYSLRLNTISGHYFVAIKPNKSTNISALLTKYQLSYIAPNRNYYFSSQMILQIKSQSRKVLMQIFTCQGQALIKGYENYDDISRSNSSTEKQLNIQKQSHSCHQIFTIQHPLFSYYLQILNKKKDSPLQYQIRYQYFEQFNPYDFITIQSYSIEYKIINGDLKLEMSPPQTNSQYPLFKATIISLTYIAYASDNKMDIMKYSRCSINGKIEQSSTDNIDNLTLHKKILSNIFKPNQSYFYVTAQVEILLSVSSFAQPTHQYKNRLNIFYNTIQLSVGLFSNSQNDKKSNRLQQLNLIQYVIVTVILTLGFSLLTVGFICLVKKLKYLRDKSKQLTEQAEAIPSTTNIPTQQIIALSQNQPQTGEQIIKQQI